MDYVKKVCDHVINGINMSETVSRVVLTSSIAAVISESDMQELVRRPVLYEDRYPDEQNPRRTLGCWKVSVLKAGSVSLPGRQKHGALRMSAPASIACSPGWVLQVRHTH